MTTAGATCAPASTRVTVAAFPLSTKDERSVDMRASPARTERKSPSTTSRRCTGPRCWERSQQPDSRSSRRGRRVAVLLPALRRAPGVRRRVCAAARRGDVAGLLLGAAPVAGGARRAPGPPDPPLGGPDPAGVADAADACCLLTGGFHRPRRSAWVLLCLVFLLTLGGGWSGTRPSRRRPGRHRSPHRRGHSRRRPVRRSVADRGPVR